MGKDKRGKHLKPRLPFDPKNLPEDLDPGDLRFFYAPGRPPKRPDQSTTEFLKERRREQGRPPMRRPVLSVAKVLCGKDSGRH